MFSYLIKLVFTVLLRFKVNCLRGQDILIYYDQASLVIVKTCLFNVIDKPPDNFHKRKRYFRMKQQYSSFLRFYGSSLVGGIDKAKAITVTETEAKKKVGKNKQEKMVSFESEPFINITFPKWNFLSQITFKIFAPSC